MIRRILIISMLVFWCASVFSQTKINSEYRISPNDLIEVSIYEEPDLSKTVRVSPDGTITYPLIGIIQAQGMTAKELETKLTELLEKDFLVNPQVNVFIKEHAKIFINGRVKNPGAYEMKAGLTVKEAITMAGGLSEDGNPRNVKLLRNVNGQKQVYEIDIMAAKTADKDMFLQPSDEIMVEDLGTISVLGQVSRPGSYKLKQNMSIMEGIAAAGGFTKEGDARNVRLLRTLNNQKQTIAVDTTQPKSADKEIYLQPGDEITVEELGMVSVLGQVKISGRYTLKKNMTVVDMIAVAGGLTNIAAPNGTKVIRVKNGKKQVISIPLGSILRGGDKSKDIILENGDTIVVPESFF